MPRERIAIVGNGIIGHGVAQVFAMAGHDVTLIGRKQDSLGRALANIRASLDDFVAHGLIEAKFAAEIPKRIETAMRLDAAAKADLVIEAVTEDLPLKIGIFAELDRLCRKDAILASSSGQPASALVAKVAGRARVIATHFWYPPQLIPLVEICGGPFCAPEIVARSVAIIRAIGKEPVVIDKEVKGFIGNRLQFALLREAWQLWADGVASAEAIDAVARNSFGRRLGVTGPIESADIGGLGTMVAFARFLQPDLATTSLPPDKVAARVAPAPANGMPGLYDWSRRDAGQLRARRMRDLFRWLKADREAAK